ncbi:hypothetical protein WJX72_003270 [[Myrmecia] bisecta]|uniref:Uncharacterized protein n=1 Tax=[Myrmecia] bisecta TaxID=41462 RepID=A0AAW1QB80_9CHLO
MRNVTTDYDQLASIVQEFFRQPQSLDMLNASAITEAQFRAFLMHKASRSFPALENSLDWVLCIYKIAFPFMIFLIILKISSSGSTTDQAAKGQSTDSQHLQQTFVSPPSSPAASTISGRTFSTISDNSEQMMVRSRSALHRPRF